MATTIQVLELIQFAIYGDHQNFSQTAEKIAENLMKRGHKLESDQIKGWLKDYASSGKQETTSKLSYEQPDLDFTDLILPDSIMDQLKEVILERKEREELSKYNLTPTKSILLVGHPGTGKTLTASVLSHELGLPLKEIRFTSFLDSKLGQTGKDLSFLFNSIIEQTPGVYFFDEFDALASQRSSASQGAEKEYNEIVNTILKGMDHLAKSSNGSYIVASTNLESILDSAIKRRFDLTLHYPDTSTETAQRLLKHYLAGFKVLDKFSKTTLQVIARLNPADIEKICSQAKKKAILYDQKINDELLQNLAKQRNDTNG